MRVGILTSGGDTPGMNAVLRAAHIRARDLGHELVGIVHGWKGLMAGEHMELPEDIEDMIDLGGTILRSERANPYAREGGVEKIRQTMKDLALDCLIAIGGEDTLGVANRLNQDGIPVVGVPKTIDNDLDATDYTFGFNTAYSIATEALDRAKTTARSHDRVLVIEIMGRHAGWMTLYAGIAAGAHAILIPEHPLSLDTVAELIERRYKRGDTWAIVAVSEGFGFSDEQVEEGEKDEFGHVRLEKQEIGNKVADALKEKLGVPTRAIKLGHVQRGGPPSAYDRVLCTRLGVMAMELVHSGNFGMMPALRGTSVRPVPLSDAVAKLKVVDDEHWELAKKIMGLD